MINSGEKFLGLLTKCKDELYVYEFCNYYLSQGVDKIYILDDDSFDKHIYDKVLNKPNIEVIFTKNVSSQQAYSNWYVKVKHEFVWLINVDIDEYITTKKNFSNTIRDELMTTFKDVDCIKIPWVFMSFNSIKNNPESILNSNIFRWNHDLKHPHPKVKFRCRYNAIEVKCIFKTSKFDGCIHHIPKNNNSNTITVNSINGALENLSCYYQNLRENDITDGILVCYHYRLNSVEHCYSKIQHNKYYHQFTIDDLIAFDYPEIIDETLKIKYNLI